MDDNELYRAFALKQRVKNVGSDYFFAGIVIAAFQKRSGALRCVVENNDGILHIMSGKQLVLQDAKEEIHEYTS